MAVDKAKLLRSFKADLKSSEYMKLQWDAKRKIWVNATEGLPYGNEVEGKSAIVSKDIKKQLEWQHSKIIDPFVSSNDIVKCFPITYEDTPAAKQNELLLNTQFCRKFDRFNFMSKATKVLEREGTVVIQTGWDYEDEEVEVDAEVVLRNEYGEEYIGTKKAKHTIVHKNQPTAKVCRNEDIFIDPTCQDNIDACQFVIYRYESDISTLKKDGRYKNLDRVNKSLGSNFNDPSYYPQDPTRFQFEDEARKKLVVYEYWGNYDVDEDGVTEPVVCVWVGDTIIRLEGNPYPDGKPPFIIVPFNAIPFQMYGEANAELIGDNQKIKTAVIRGVIDNMAQSNNGQIGVRKGALDPINRKKWLQGKNFEFNGGPADFWQGGYNVIPNSAFDLIGLMNNEMESLTGVKSFSGGITGSSLGAMLDIETDIPMIDGSFKKLRDIQDGDELIGSNGKSTSVTKAHEIQYPKQAYDMYFNNGGFVKSGGEHLWTIKVAGTKHSLRKWHTVDADTVYEHLQAGRTVTIPKIQEILTGEKVTSSMTPRCRTVKITAMEKVDKVLMRCLTVDSDDRLYAVTDRFILTHNTATAARGVQDATSVRNMNIVRNIAENMVKPLLRKWMSYNSEFLEEEEIVRVTNDEFVPVRKDDLEGRIDIDLTIATLEDQSAKAQELSFLLQTIGNSVDPGITNELMAQILDLSRMPEQAKKIRDFKPEPDPVQEQLKQLEIQRLQLENAKLQSETARNESIAAENEIDKQVKLAKAAKDEATARSIHSKTDLDDLAFLRIENGEEESSKVRAEELKHMASLDKLAMGNMGKDKEHARKLEIEELKHKSSLDKSAFDAIAKERLLKVKPQNVIK